MPKAAKREVGVEYVTTTTQATGATPSTTVDGSGENPNPSLPTTMEQEQSGFLPSRVPDAAIQYVLDRYHYIDGTLIVQGHIAAMSAEWTIKRGEYSSDSVRAYAQMQFGQNSSEPFKCDFVVREPRIKVIDSDGDTAIVREVYQQFARLLDLATNNLMVEHLQTLYLDMPPEAPKKPKGVDASKKDARKEVKEEEL